MKKITILFLCLSLIIYTVIPAAASPVPTEPASAEFNEPLPVNEQASAEIGENLQISAKSAILMEYNTGKVLYESNADVSLAPASITKIMTLILVMEAIESGKLSLDDKITASEHAAGMGGSQIWLEPGEVMTVNDLLKATVIASANDATVALAEAVSGSEEVFVKLMNEKADALGMESTHFVNSYGLDAEEHLTTAYDVALMSRELIKHDLIREYSTVRMDSLRNGESELTNTNKLIRYYDGCFGLKTGTTSKAGSCLAAAAERQGLTLIAVVLGSPTSKDRFAGCQKLLDFGFANYSYINIEPDTSGLHTIPVKKGTEAEIIPEINGSFSALFKKGDEEKVISSLSLSEELTAPVKKGDTVGRVDFYLNGQEIGSVKVTAKNGSDRLTYGICLMRLLKSLFTL